MTLFFNNTPRHASLYQGRLPKVYDEPFQPRNPRTDVHDERPSRRGHDSLFRAIADGQIKKVRYLLSYGASVNSRSANNLGTLVAALHIDDDTKRSSMFLMLLKRGASYTVRDDYYHRPVMHWACVLGRHQQVSQLLEETAGDINLADKDKDGLTALHHAVIAGSLLTVKLLVNFHVRFGIPVDVPDKLGLTPYTHARRLGFHDIADVLLKQGFASTEHADNLFRSPRVWSHIGKTQRQKALDFEIKDRETKSKIMGHFTSLNNNVLNKPAQPHGCQKSKISLHKTSETKLIYKEAANNDFKNKLSTDNHLHSQKGSAINDNQPQSVRRDLHFKDKILNNSLLDINATLRGNRISYNNSTNIFGNNYYLGSIDLQNDRRKHAQKLPAILQKSRDENFNNYIKRAVVQDERQPNFWKQDQRAVTVVPAFVTGSSNYDTALSLLQQTVPENRINNDFHSSVFDLEKVTEYKYILGDLNNLLDILSQQNTKSFRTAAQPEKPVTIKPPQVNRNQNKISSWAVLFGNKNGRKRRDSRSTSSSLTKRNLTRVRQSSQKLLHSRDATKAR